MSGFTDSWLALREPADRLARSARLSGIEDAVARSPEPRRPVDLAGGNGSNVRFLAERLPGIQAWVVVDDDSELLTRVPSRMRSWCDDRGFAIAHESGGSVMHGDRLVCQVGVRHADLAVDLEQVIEEGVCLVTASALLDLVSERWLNRLARRCEQIRSAALFALTYDGRVRCSPEEPEDAVILDLVNRHQRGDKGFGPALGPNAASQAEQRFRAHGYQVRLERSDWVLPPDAEALQRALIEGWTEAALAIAGDRESEIGAWKHRRLRHVTDGQSFLTVGHQDIAAWLPEAHR